MVRVRRAVPEDADLIAAVHVRTWQVAYRGLMPDALLDGLSAERRAEMWRTVTAEDSAAVYVAVDDGRVVGFCGVATPSRDEDAKGDVAEIGAIYVDPDVWRRGVGRALMDVVLADLRAAGWRWLTLWVLAENEQARDFYARFGFALDGARRTAEGTGVTEVRLLAPVAG